jgi:hypothetical protein
MRGTVKRASLLADRSREVKAQAGEGGIRLTISGDAPDPIASVVAIELDGPIEPIAQRR